MSKLMVRHLRLILMIIVYARVNFIKFLFIYFLCGSLKHMGLAYISDQDIWTWQSVKSKMLKLGSTSNPR